MIPKGWNLNPSIIDTDDIIYEEKRSGLIGEILNLEMEPMVLAIYGNTTIGSSMFTDIVESWLERDLIKYKVLRVTQFNLYLLDTQDPTSLDVLFIDNLEFTLFDNKKKLQLLELIDKFQFKSKLVILNLPSLQDLNAAPKILVDYFLVTKNYMEIKNDY